MFGARQTPALDRGKCLVEMRRGGVGGRGSADSSSLPPWGEARNVGQAQSPRSTAGAVWTRSSPLATWKPKCYEERSRR